MRRILIDTNIYSKALRGDKTVVDVLTRQCIVLFYLAEIMGNKKQTLCHFVLGKESCAISIYYAD